MCLTSTCKMSQFHASVKKHKELRTREKRNFEKCDNKIRSAMNNQFFSINCQKRLENLYISYIFHPVCIWLFILSLLVRTVLVFLVTHSGFVTNHDQLFEAKQLLSILS